MIADEPISKIEVQGEQDSGELVGNLYFGATCEALSVNDNARNSFIMQKLRQQKPSWTRTDNNHLCLFIFHFDLPLLFRANYSLFK